MVRYPSSFRIPATWRIDGWKTGAKRKQKLGIRAPGGERLNIDVTTGGVTARREAPREVRMSALPEVEVEARLPCLPRECQWWVRLKLAGGGGVHIRRPQPEARMAEVVDTLKVLWPSPPVPTISTYSPSVSLFISVRPGNLPTRRNTSRHSRSSHPHHPPSPQSSNLPLAWPLQLQR